MLHLSVVGLYGRIFCVPQILFHRRPSTKDCRPILEEFFRRMPAFVRTPGAGQAGSLIGGRSLLLSASRTRYTSKPPTFLLQQHRRREPACSTGNTVSIECDSCSTTRLGQDDGA